MNYGMIDLSVPKNRHKGLTIPAPLIEAAGLAFLAILFFPGV